MVSPTWAKGRMRCYHNLDQGSCTQGLDSREPPLPHQDLLDRLSPLHRLSRRRSLKQFLIKLQPLLQARLGAPVTAPLSTSTLGSLAWNFNMIDCRLKLAFTSWQGKKTFAGILSPATQWLLQVQLRCRGSLKLGDQLWKRNARLWETWRPNNGQLDILTVRILPHFFQQLRVGGGHFLLQSLRLGDPGKQGIPKVQPFQLSCCCLLL